MVKRKASAATPATPAVSSQSAGAARATAAAGQSVPQAAPRSGSSSSSASAPPTHYYQSGKDEYRVPKAWNDPLGYLRSVWDLYEATFAISMLETWESILLHGILLIITYFLYWATTNYLPDHLRIIASRARYYFSGVDE